MKSRRFASFAFAVTTILTLGWLLTYPPYGVSDEPAHTVKAVAAGHLQLSGKEEIGQFGYQAEVFDVPYVYTSIWHFICYSAGTDITPACVGDFPTDRSVVQTTSTAAAYPPLYYVAVGWIGWLIPSQTGFYLMRLMSAILSLLVLAFAYKFATETARPNFAVGAIFVATTPAVTSFIPTINPFGLEVTLAILFWVVSIKILQKSKASRGDAVAIWSTGLCFGLTRPASFVWMGLILVGLIAFYFDWRWKSIFSFQWVTVLIAALLAIFTSVMWIAFRVGSTNFGGGLPASDSLVTNIRIAFQSLDDNVLEMFGFFGWTSFMPPVIVPMLGLFAIVSLASPASKMIVRKNWVASLCVVFLPLLLEGARASSNGFGYQGRYLLPVAVGLPILFSQQEGSDVDRRSLNIIVFSAGFSGVLALGYCAHRYLVGMSGPYFWIGNEVWQPPFSGLVLAILVLTSLVGTFVVARLSNTSNSRFLDSDNEFLPSTT